MCKLNCKLSYSFIMTFGIAQFVFLELISLVYNIQSISREDQKSRTNCEIKIFSFCF